jgi:hydrogenase maturation protein HypF
VKARPATVAPDADPGHPAPPAPFPVARVPAGRLIEVTGLVQGVGFRPFVWRLAQRYGLTGWVLNRSGMVEVVVEGEPAALDAFCRDLSTQAPPLASVESVRWWPRQPVGMARFEVESSIEADGEGDRMISPDVATCPACLAELLDPADRRFGYPFINCTDCGPRFTIIESLPYDRDRTSMRAFPLCEPCAREYHDPADRRFHAEPVACPGCGPHLTLLDAAWGPLPGAPVEAAAALLAEGRIVAVKGLGGFHLACDARNDGVVAELRRRKGRPDKPFAVMVPTLEMAEQLFEVTPAEAHLLSSPQAPIVLVVDRGGLSTLVAPGFGRQGAMLPATPLHHLLLRAANRPLVMTSGNRTDEPICVNDAQARRRLTGVADSFLTHDREIVARYDDSVAKVRGTTLHLLRRARGFAPSPIELAALVPPVFGVGAELHGAFCLAAGRRAFLSQHIGDLDSEEAMHAYREAFDRSRALFEIEPEAVAHDLHPDFLSTRFAQEVAEAAGIPAVAVQHHHAHVAAVMAEHGLVDGRVIGIAFDGFGLGDDGTSWGGEFLVASLATAERVGHLRQVRQPGADAAVRNPIRMALAHAADADVLKEALRILGKDRSDVKTILQQIGSGFNSPLTSSAGRLFDAISALTGVCRRASFEGQPAILLEEAADASATYEYPFEVGMAAGEVVVDTRPLIAAVVKDLARGRHASEVAGRFHRTLTAATVSVTRLIRGQTGLNRVALSGGVFANDLFASDLAARLGSCDFEVFLPHQVPVGDGGIALGQALVAAARIGGA